MTFLYREMSRSPSIQSEQSTALMEEIGAPKQAYITIGKSRGIYRYML